MLATKFDWETNFVMNFTLFVSVINLFTKIMLNYEMNFTIIALTDCFLFTSQLLIFEVSGSIVFICKFLHYRHDERIQFYSYKFVLRLLAISGEQLLAGRIGGCEL